jgi:hypothetical protein
MKKDEPPWMLSDLVARITNNTVKKLEWEAVAQKDNPEHPVHEELALVKKLIKEKSKKIVS